MTPLQCTQVLNRISRWSIIITLSIGVNTIATLLTIFL